MKDFHYYAPTEVVFGAESEQQIPELIKRHGGKRVMLHYGGRSAEVSGLLPSVRTMLAGNGIEFVELGGVVPNPRLSKVREGIDIVRKESVDFILAVGGGSVIDSAKAIGYGAVYDGDVWDFYTGRAAPAACLPVGVVLTLPAAGSEMSGGSVITNEDGDSKRACDNDLSRPKFAVMNPERTFGLPPFQTACGIVDIMMHTMERYFSHETDMTLTDEIAEALLRTVRNIAPKVLAEPDNYVLRAQIMWAGSLAHNDLTGCGNTDDWATHMLEHELSGMFDVAHGAGLAAMWGSWARYVYKTDVNRFARFAVNVMGVVPASDNAEVTALDGIKAMEAFYRSIGMPTCISELIGRKASSDEIREMARKCSLGGTSTIGNFLPLGIQDMVAVYDMANK